MRLAAALLPLSVLVLAVPLAAQEDAAVAFARGDYAAVVALLEPPLRAGTASPPQRLLLARAWLRLDRAQPAAEALAGVLAADGEHPEANRLAGEALLRLGRHADALAALKKAQRVAPDSATAGLMGRCAFALGDVARAKEWLDEAVAADVRDPGLGVLLARIHLARGGGALAERHLLLAQEAGLDTPELHRLLGQAYLLQRKLVGPIVRRRPTAEPQPGDPVDGWIALGPAPGGGGEWLLSSRWCALAEGLWLTAHDARDADGHVCAAAGWLALGRADAAQPHLAALTEVEPDSARRLGLAAEAALLAGDGAALEAVVARAQAARVEVATLVAWLRRLAMGQAARGGTETALATLLRADALDPTAAPVLRALAELRTARGERAEAALCWRRLLDLHPDAPDAEEMRNALAALTLPEVRP